jgi:hypothetical protein
MCSPSNETATHICPVYMRPHGYTEYRKETIRISHYPTDLRLSRTTYRKSLKHKTLCRVSVHCSDHAMLNVNAFLTQVNIPEDGGILSGK